jgi:hypothetical protein
MDEEQPMKSAALRIPVLFLHIPTPGHFVTGEFVYHVAEHQSALAARLCMNRF